MSKALQKKLNRFVELGNAIEAEAKRLYGPGVFLFHEAGGSVVLMDGDEDDSVRSRAGAAARQDHIVMTSAGGATWGSGAW